MCSAPNVYMFVYILKKKKKKKKKILIGTHMVPFKC